MLIIITWNKTTSSQEFMKQTFLANKRLKHNKSVYAMTHYEILPSINRVLHIYLQCPI